MSKRHLAVAICLIALSTGYYLVVLSGCTQEQVDRREESFANTVADIVGVAVPLNKELNLTPSDSRLYTEDGITLFVFNRVGYDLVFADNIFGVRGFAFNEDESRWEEVDLSFTPFDPEPRRLRNGTTEIEETSAIIFAVQMDTRKYKEIRLLVVGYAEDTPTLRAYGAYADVEVVEGPDPSVIHVIPTITSIE